MAFGPLLNVAVAGAQQALGAPSSRRSVTTNVGTTNKIEPVYSIAAEQAASQQTSTSPQAAAPIQQQTAQQLATPTNPKIRPVRLVQDTGAAGLDQALRKLKTTARLLQTTAHPDDEDGGMLTYQARGKGATVMLMSMTRGDGGQNKTGSNLFDELGVLRTLELMESTRFYGTDLRFSRVADFGFSKSPDEAFAKWGKEVMLEDMVRVIREFRPDVVACAWSGTPNDGHGHHQAVGIITPEAVKAAADPTRFPDQIKDGLLPWQVKKLYHRASRNSTDYTVRFDAGKVDPDLGTSYAQLGVEGYSHQASQNAQDFLVQPGVSWRPYKMDMTTLPKTTDADGHEQDFFDGIDTTLPGLASWLGDEEKKLPRLREQLTFVENAVDIAIQSKDSGPDKIGELISEAWMSLAHVVDEVKVSQLTPLIKLELMTRLETKNHQFAEALQLTLPLALPQSQPNYAFILTKSGSPMVVPGERFFIQVDKPLQNAPVQFRLPPNWKQLQGKAPGEFIIDVPNDAELTRPFWHRHDPERDMLHTIDDRRYATLATPTLPVRAEIRFGDDAPQAPHIVINAIATADDTKRTPIAVVPAYSLLMEHGSEIVPRGQTKSFEANVNVRKVSEGSSDSKVELALPKGWKVTPVVANVHFDSAGEKNVHFDVTPLASTEQDTEIRAELTDSKGKKYSEGFSVVTREDLSTFYYYQPSVQKVHVVDVAVPTKLKLGYIMGAGDDIFPALQQLGIDAMIISPEELASDNLSHYNTIILGIRAYDTRDDVRKNNARLLKFVEDGGTLVVQNNFSVNDFNNGKYTPFPMTLSNQRVSVEEAPVDVLAPQDPIFQYPNAITTKDFDGWIQERGVNFMTKWDEHFQPLLASGDPGEAKLQGGLLRARYGKGTYIYTGYAFFRQIPAGVPGAIRLYVNLLSSH